MEWALTRKGRNLILYGIGLKINLQIHLVMVERETECSLQEPSGRKKKESKSLKEAKAGKHIQHEPHLDSVERPPLGARHGRTKSWLR